MLRRMQINFMASPDDQGILLRNIISPRGPSPTDADYEQFYITSGQQFDLATLIKYMDRHCGFQGVRLVDMGQFAGVQITTEARSLIQQNKIKVVRRFIVPLLRTKLGLTDADLDPRNPEAEWKRDEMLRLLLHPGFRVTDAITSTALQEARTQLQAALESLTENLWDRTLTRQEIWRVVKPTFMGLVQSSRVMSQQHQAMMIQTLRGGIAGDPAPATFKDAPTPKFYFGISSKDTLKSAEKRIAITEGVLTLKAAFCGDGSNVEVGGALVRGTFGLVVYHFESNADADNVNGCSICDASPVAGQPELWSCQCGNTLCRDCIGSTVLSSIVNENPQVRREGGRCPFCRNSWTQVLDLVPLRGEVVALVNTISAMNGRRCPLAEADCIVPVNLPFGLTRSSIYSSLWSLMGLPSTAETLRLNEGLGAELSVYDIIRIRGPHYVTDGPDLPFLYLDGSGSVLHAVHLPDEHAGGQQQHPLVAAGPADEAGAEENAVEEQQEEGAVEEQQAEGAVEEQQAEGAVEEQQAEGAVEEQQAEGAVEEQQAEGAVVDPEEGHAGDAHHGEAAAADQAEIGGPAGHGAAPEDHDNDAEGPQDEAADEDGVALSQRVLLGVSPIPKEWIGRTNNKKRSIWVEHRNYREIKAQKDNKYMFRSCCKGCSVTLVLQERENGIFITRAPKAHPASCNQVPDPRRETQTRLRHQVQDTVASEGRRNGLVEDVVADGGLAQTTRNDFRNSTQAGYRAERARDGSAKIRSFERDRAGYYEDFVDFVVNKTTTTRGSDFPFILYSDHETPMIIWGASRNIEALSRASGMIWDATFLIAPKGWSQLWAGLAEIDGHYVPVYFVLMKDKSQNQYERALRKIGTDLAQRHLYQVLQTLYFITDFEPAMRNAFRSEWEIGPQKLRGCLFHLCKAWIRAIQAEGLAADYWANEATRSERGKWMHSLMGLPCLPEAECQETWEALKTEPPAADPQVQNLVQYLDGTYFGDNAVYSATEWACEPRENTPPQRTTNPLEGLNHHINKGVTKSSSIQVLCDKMLMLQVKAEVTLNSVEQGEPADASRSKEPMRLRHYQLYRQQVITRKRYLELISRLCGVNRLMVDSN
ncbi:hypothetical protein FOZ60_010994 [Perkinsus olseni]|uniref:RING-type domain-containing protein n=1 Tax=Perkinsus olseni TaxID=32597 RepID=A0A7J6NEH4_PEROL|nr:hypothetical protein FOZ60_010994 [Perkinsus olseni]